MFLDLLYNNKEMYQLLSYGVEGEDYNNVDGNLREDIDTNRLSPDLAIYGMEKQEFMLESAASPKDYVKYRESKMAEGKPYSLNGFTFDKSNVSNELENVTSVAKEYLMPLALGYVEKEEGLATLKKQFENAGIDKVAEEIQRQIDEYVATK